MPLTFVKAQGKESDTWSVVTPRVLEGHFLCKTPPLPSSQERDRTSQGAGSQDVGETARLGVPAPPGACVWDQQGSGFRGQPSLQHTDPQSPVLADPQGKAANSYTHRRKGRGRGEESSRIRQPFLLPSFSGFHNLPLGSCPFHR